MKRFQRGFTLIELLAVIAIIGILAALILVSLSRARMQARDTQRKATTRAIAQAEESYYNSNAGYVLGAVDSSSSIISKGFLTLPTTAPWTSGGAAGGRWTVSSDTSGYKVGTCLEADKTKGFQCIAGGNCSDIATGCSY